MNKKYLNYKKSFEKINKIKIFDEKTGKRRSLKAQEDYRIFFNSSIIRRPKLLNESVKYFGSSTIIASIEAIKISDRFMCLSDSGRE